MFAVKICGMRTPQDVQICTEAGADALGFIFASGSAKLEFAAAIGAAAWVPAHVRRVGVFADQEATLVRTAIQACALDMLQFCGFETAAFCGSFGLPTIIALGIQPGKTSAGIPDRAWLREARAQALLIDSRDGQRLGGTGMRVDPLIAAAIAVASPLPCILAGGLTPGNVAAAVEAVRPSAVDVRGGVERGGDKDPSLVRAFVNAARSAGQIVA